MSRTHFEFKEGVARGDKKITSYDTTKPDTNTAQKVRQGNEPEAEQLRKARADDKEISSDQLLDQ